MREAVWFVMKGDHMLTASVFALVTAFVSTVVVHSGCRNLVAAIFTESSHRGRLDTVRSQVLGVGRLHKRQDVLQELDVFG